MSTTTRATGTVQRYSRRTRWFHALTYLAVLALAGTGWWLVSGREGQASPLARLTGTRTVTGKTDKGDPQFGYDLPDMKPVAPILRHIPLFSGNTILGDGSVIMILDPNGVAAAAGEMQVNDDFAANDGGLAARTAAAHSSPAIRGARRRVSRRRTRSCCSRR